MRHGRLAVALTAVLAVGVAAATPTEAQTLPQAATCGGVWVVVDYGALGGTSTRCATSYRTGAAALKSAGFSTSIADGFVYKIDGKPSQPDVNKAYWSYWTATSGDDGAYGAWAYSNVGADGSSPRPGRAEGWRYQTLAEGKVAPAVKPPALVDEPEPEPTQTASPKPTRKPSATPRPTRSATSGATRSAAPSPDPSRRPTPSTATAATRAASSVQASASPAASATQPASDAATTVARAELSGEPEPGNTGTPIGVVVAGGLVACGAAGVGGWWLRRGRRR